MKKRLAVLAAVVCAVALVASVASAGVIDFGQFVQGQLRDQSNPLFGVNGTLQASSTRSITKEQAQADPRDLVTLAKSLRVRVVSAGVAPPNLDQSAFWPNAKHPEWLITCNEEGVAQAGLVRINLATGASTTMVTGTTSCDPVRATPWGTILFGEEAGGGPNGGRMYELIDPLNTTGVTLDRATGTFSGGTGAGNLVARPALGRLSFEGLAIYSSGVTYFGDELRPAGGQGVWVPIPAAPDPDLRAQAAALHLTGYYRPEDIDIDRGAEANGKVSFCGNNTANETEQLWGETVCISDGSLQQAGANTAVPEVRRFVQGSPAFAMPDNAAYQPGRGNWIIHEDAETNTALQGPHNNDLWDCLPDGADPDLQSDGCVRIATLNDLTAEWTGGFFDASGDHFFVSVQHNISGSGTILDITGWK